MSNNNVVFGTLIGVVIAATTIAVVFAPGQATAVIGLSTLICVQVLALMKTTSVEAKQVENSAKLDTITSVVADVKTTGEAVHTLTNSSQGAALKLAATFARRLANETKKPIDEDAATEAERMYHEHVAKQATVDAGPPLPRAAPPTTDEPEVVLVVKAPEQPKGYGETYE